MTENKRRTGIITLEEARERFNDYYNKRNKTPIGRLRGKFFDAAYQKKDRFLLKPGEPGSEKYMLEEGPRTFDMEGVDYFPEDTTFEVEADGKIKRGASKGATYYKNGADNEPREDLSPPNVSGRQTSKHIYGPRKNLTNELYSTYFKKHMSDRKGETGDLGSRSTESGKNLIDIYWEQSRKGKHTRKNKKITNKINPAGKNMIQFDMTNDMDIDISLRYKYIIDIGNRLIHKWIPRVKKYAELGTLDYDGYLDMDFVDHIIENYLNKYFTKDSFGNIITTDLVGNIEQSDIEVTDSEFYEYYDLPDNIIVRRIVPDDGVALIVKGDYNWHKNPAPIFMRWDDFLDRYEINIEELEELDADQFDVIMRNAVTPDNDTSSQEQDANESGEDGSDTEPEEEEQEEEEPEEEDQEEEEQAEEEQEEEEQAEEDQEEEEQAEEEQEEEEQAEEEPEEVDQAEEEQEEEDQAEEEQEEEEQEEEEQEEEGPEEVEQEEEEEDQEEEEQEEVEQEEEEQEEEEQDAEEEEDAQDVDQEDDGDGEEGQEDDSLADSLTDSDDDSGADSDDDSDDDWMSSGDGKFKLSNQDAEYVLDNANSNISDDYFNRDDASMRRFIASL
jgi:DNA segregation ATPase FtsK/SpoIIIE-like protein